MADGRKEALKEPQDRDCTPIYISGLACGWNRIGSPQLLSRTGRCNPGNCVLALLPLWFPIDLTPKHCLLPSLCLPNGRRQINKYLPPGKTCWAGFCVFPRPFLILPVIPSPLSRAHSCLGFLEQKQAQIPTTISLLFPEIPSPSIALCLSQPQSNSHY